MHCPTRCIFCVCLFALTVVVLLSSLLLDKINLQSSKYIGMDLRKCLEITLSLLSAQHSQTSPKICYTHSALCFPLWLRQFPTPTLHQNNAEQVAKDLSKQWTHYWMPYASTQLTALLFCCFGFHETIHFWFFPYSLATPSFFLFHISVGHSSVVCPRILFFKPPFCWLCVTFLIFYVFSKRHTQNMHLVGQCTDPWHYKIWFGDYIQMD